MSVQRIAYVLHIFPKLSETFVAGELAELRRRGIDLRILSLLPPREELQHEIIRRARLTEITTYDVTKFAEVIREFKPQILHAHFATEATAKARELSSSCGVPYTFTAHGYDIHRKPPADFRDRAMAAGAVVTVSDANADYIVNTFNVPRNHLNVISCGVDTDEFCPPANRSLRGNESDEDGQQSNPPPHVGGTIVCVARFVAVKNLCLLLDACALLCERGVDFRCVIIGDGPLRAELESKRASLKLETIVEMPGAARQDEVLKWWQRAAVGVLSSENEGMPVCLMEAAACGVPVVATHVGGVPELVRDGETGLLTPMGDAGALATALERILRDTELRQRMSKAARRRAVEQFSVARQVGSLLALWRKVLAAGPDAKVAMADEKLPTFSTALDFETARHEFKRRLPRLSGEGKLRLKAIRLTRHKPGKRAVVEYDVEIRRPDVPEQKLTIIGKLRARRSGNEAFRQLETIWNAGFDAQSVDGISVPEPIGVIAKFQMWFQRKVAGVTVEELLSGADGIALARRVAEAIHKLHRANLPTEKQHMMADELRILRECFKKVAELKPDWAQRLTRLMAACEKMGASVPEPVVCGIHRDFYPAQVIVDGARLWLLDFDLFCLGDPGLDVGNFIGHVTEQALRERGDAGALRDVERALEDKFVELSDEKVRAAVRAYTTLTLARHIFLSTRFPDRQHLTEELIKLCEARLGLS